VRDEDIIGFFARSVGVEDGVTKYIALESDSDGGADPVIGPDVLIGPMLSVGYVTAFVREQAPFYRIARSAPSRADGARRSPPAGLGPRLSPRPRASFAKRARTYYTVYTSAATNRPCGSISAPG
jgi:hypothetical protein